MRPFELLPIKRPCDYDPGPVFFYENVVSKLIPDIIKLTEAGMYVDQDQVEVLRHVVKDVLSDVDGKLLRNPIIQEYQEIRQERAQKKHAAKSVEAVRDASYYLKEYNGSIEHRTAVVNQRLKNLGKEKDTKPKWTVTELKTYLVFNDDTFLDEVVTKTVRNKHPVVLEAMQSLAQAKADLWNKPRYAKAKSKASIEPFNPNSSKQVQELFKLLEIEPMAFSDTTGEPSWGRDLIIELKKQTPEKYVNLHDILQCLIDASYGGIIKSTFIPAFDKYTIDGVLYGNIKLFGAKSFRPTSNNPNLLNMPSTKSIYAKPLKKAFVAPDGYWIYAIDLSALEDRVIANLSGDQNKMNVFLEGLDGHSLNACGYFPEEIKELLGEFPTMLETVKAFMAEVDKENKEVGAIRQNSKPPTFKLAYGGFPDSHKGGVITQEIFDNYHNVLYPGITEYRENYVLKTAKEQGYLHLGLGCRIYTDNPDKDIRTLNNATVQFWSILTLIAINEINHRAKECGFEDDVIVHATIYDSLYFYVKQDLEVVKWLNDNAVEVLCADYIEDQVIPNEAQGEIGMNWADLHKLPNSASIEKIQEVVDKFANQ